MQSKTKPTNLASFLYVSLVIKLYFLDRSSFFIRLIACIKNNAMQGAKHAPIRCVSVFESTLRPSALRAAKALAPSHHTALSCTHTPNSPLPHDLWMSARREPRTGHWPPFRAAAFICQFDFVYLDWILNCSLKPFVKGSGQAQGFTGGEAR